MATKKETTTVVDVPELQLGYFDITLFGETPLICHAWAEKAKMAMLNKQQKKAATAKEVRRPSVEFADSLYWLTEKPNLDGLTDEEAGEVLEKVIPQSKFGFPTIAFKAAALDAGFQQGALVRNAGSGDLSKTTARGAFHIDGEFVTLEGIPTPREDMARVGMGTADLRYRAEFKSWQATLKIKYNARVVTPAQIVNLFKLAGFSNGIGDWRPARGGSFGTFSVA